MEGGDAPELKGGHAPAQKVGGMRVVQKKDKEDKPGTFSYRIIML